MSGKTSTTTAKLLGLFHKNLVAERVPAEVIPDLVREFGLSLIREESVVVTND